MQAYILINCNTGSETKVISELKEFPEIVEINGIWGKHDIFIKIRTADPNGVENRLSKDYEITLMLLIHLLCMCCTVKVEPLIRKVNS